jgi:hypothetical protein
MGLGGRSHAPAALPLNDPVPILQEAGSAWTGAENLAPHRDSIPGVQLVASRYTDWANAAHKHNFKES